MHTHERNIQLVRRPGGDPTRLGEREAGRAASGAERTAARARWWEGGNAGSTGLFTLARGADAPRTPHPAAARQGQRAQGSAAARCSKGRTHFSSPAAAPPRARAADSCTHQAHHVPSACVQAGLRAGLMLHSCRPVMSAAGGGVGTCGLAPNRRRRALACPALAGTTPDAAPGPPHGATPLSLAQTPRPDAWMRRCNAGGAQSLLRWRSTAEPLARPSAA